MKGKMMEKKKKLNSLIPEYAVIPLLMIVGVNGLVYNGAGKLAENWKHYDLTTPFDRMVPVIPWFSIIYLGCFLFWIVNYIIIARQGKEYCFRFATADIMSRLICLIFFLAFPTTNIRPVLEESGFWNWVLSMIYKIDAPVNLFPSIHCLVSWFCYIGIRRRENIPKWYRVFSCIFACLVFVSTQVTKQHYIIDVIAGVALAEITYHIAFRTEIYKGLKYVADKLNRIIFINQKKASV